MRTFLLPEVQRPFPVANLYFTLVQGQLFICLAQACEPDGISVFPLPSLVVYGTSEEREIDAITGIDAMIHVQLLTILCEYN